MAIRAKPSSLDKVHRHWESRDDQDPMYYALADMLQAYYRLAKLETHIDSLFGQGAAEKLLRRKDPDADSDS
jgi:hypothetical protein